MEASPIWDRTSARALPGALVRLSSDSVILPTGEILLIGGVKPDPRGRQLDVNAVKAAEIYNPETNTWSVGAPTAVTRNYHSVALLMPDGRVWTAGSNKNGGYSQEGSQEGRELAIELYEPWYYGRTDRPRITSAPTSIYPGQKFSISSTTAVSKVALVRLGSVTHSFNFDQRHIWLQTSASPLPSESGVTIRATAPPNNFVAPPGYYMLFVLRSGAPSKGRIIKLEENSSMHRVTSSNVAGNYMYIDDPLSNNTPGANLLVAPNWNPPGSSGVYSPNPIGVWYDYGAGKWSIFDETIASMEVGAAFNVKIEPLSINPTQGAPKRHTATATNSVGNYTDINDPRLNNNPNAVVIVTHNWSPAGGSNIYNPHNIGVWYNDDAGKWSIFNEDFAPMEVGLAFNYRVDGGAFVHKAISTNVYGYWTYIDHPRLNNRRNAAIVVTHNWNPGGSGGIYNDSALGVWYDTGQKRWAIFNQNALYMQEGTAFNVLILN